MEIRAFLGWFLEETLIIITKDNDVILVPPSNKKGKRRHTNFIATQQSANRSTNFSFEVAIITSLLECLKIEMCVV